MNLAEARFECVFGRGCEGICCSEGRPLVYPEEVDHIRANLGKFWPLMRPEARARVKGAGFLSGRRRLGQPTMRISRGWCVFFHQGCVLHKVGAAEGDKFRYKPAVCALFPIQQDEHDHWYVRQQGFKREKWSLFCLDPNSSSRPAADTLHDEIALATYFARKEKTARQNAAESGAGALVTTGEEKCRPLLISRKIEHLIRAPLDVNRTRLR